MNKSELLAALAAKFYFVDPPVVVSTTGTIKRYTSQCFDLLGDALRRVTVDFYVQDEGLPGEIAFWATQEPVNNAATNFHRDCEAYIAAKITDGTIRAGFIVEMDPIREVAVAWGYVVVAGDLNEVKVLLRRVSGSITHTLVNTVIHTGG